MKLSPPLQKKARTFAFKSRIAALRTTLQVQAHFSPARAAKLAEATFLTAPRLPYRTPERVALSLAERSTVSFKGQELAAWSWGHKEGPVVLLVHGWAGRGAQLQAFIAPLVNAGYRVIAFDAWGHGLSEGDYTSMLDMAESLRAVSDAFGPVYGIIAHSLGSAATALALQRGLKTERLVMVGPPARMHNSFGHFAAQMGLPTSVAARAQQRIEKRYHIQFNDLHIDRLITGQNVPLLVLHDLDDREVSWDQGEYIAQQWPGAQLVTTKGLGHLKILGDAQVIARSLAFLNREAYLEPVSPMMEQLLA